MNKKSFLPTVLVILLFCFSAQADIAPPPGYTQVSENLIFLSTDDFSEYRFFLQSPMDVEEVFIKKGETKDINAAGRGGAKRYATLIAIPKKSLGGVGNNLKDLLNTNKIEGVIKLISHSFSSQIKESEKDSWKNPKYRLERDEANGIKAVQTEGGGTNLSSANTNSANSKPASSNSSNSNGSTSQESSKNCFSMVAAGILLTLGLGFGGAWLKRKNLEKKS